MAGESENSELNAFFATPFYKGLMGLQSNHSGLKDYILSCEHGEFRHKDSPQTAHNKVFESRFDLLSWPDSNIQAFKQKLYENLMQYLAAVNGFSAQDLQNLNFKSESWFHITRSGGYFQPHTHPLASVSIIYCVDPGDETIEDSREAGQVQFTDPRYNASMFLDPTNRNMKRPFSFSGLRFRLKPDELCIFPSYLQHSVEPYVGDRPRITVAANFSFSLV